MTSVAEIAERLWLSTDFCLSIQGIDSLIALRTLRADSGASRQAQVAELRSALYRMAYLGAASQPKHEDGRLRPISALQHPGFVQILRSALPAAHWEGDCSIGHHAGGTVQIVWRGVRLSAPCRQVRQTSEAGVKSGMGRALIPCAWPLSSPGYFTVIAAHGPPAGESTVRAYINCSPQVAPTALWRILSMLAQRRKRGILKTINNPSMYGRPDSMVLYLEHDVLRELSGEFASILADLAPSLGSAVPSFALPWRRGVALAEDTRGPLQGLSFGESRCHAIAEALLDACEEGRVSPAYQANSAACTAARACHLRRSFQDAGIDPDHLYLNAGSRSDLFGFAACL